MKDFFTENRATRQEETLVKERLLDSNQEFHFTPEQLHNRLYGRTKLKPVEKIAIKQILEQIRQNKPIKN